MKRYVPAGAVVCLFLLAGSAIAQEDRAVVTGSVTDPSQSAIPGAVAEIDSKATGLHREVTTNETGVYVLPGLLIGEYSLRIRKPGFKTTEYSSFQLAVGQIRTINTQMQIASGAQEIQVEAETPALEVSSAKVGGVIGTNQVANLPLNGRAWTGLMALVPGAIDSGGGTQKSIRFAGRGIDDTNYRFDGVDASGISAQSPNASFRLQISTEAIAEFKVDTMLYGADTGGTAGGQVEAISKSGSNSFHGGLFEFIRNDKISARGPFDPSTLPPLRLNQYGASVGGAIRKNRTFFFLAYEGLRQRVGTTLIGNVPTDSFRASVLAKSPVLAPVLAAFPKGNRALSANVDQLVSTGSLSANEDSGLVRVDHRLSDSTSVFARFNIDKVALSSPSGVLLDVAQTTASPLNGTVNLSHVFKPTLFNVVQLGVNRIHTLSHTESHLFDVSKIFSSIQIPGLTTLNQQADSVKSPTTYTLKDDLTWNRGAHTIKAGIEIKQVLYNYSQASQNALVYATAAAFITNNLDQVNVLGGVPMHGLNKVMDFGYIQDQWKATKNLTLDIGMRYEFFSVFHEVHDRSLAFDLKTCGGYCPHGALFSYPQTTNFEPRASFAWSPEMLHGKTVIRSGFGMYKGEGQLGDLNAPSDNFAQRLSLSSAQFPTLSFPADSFTAAAGNQAVTPRALDRTREDPTVIQWGFQMQTALPMSFILDTGYVGYHGYHQFTRSYVNLVNPVTGLRQFSAYGPIDVKQTDGNNHFNALQASLRRQFGPGFSFSANYMWGHSINDDPQGGGEADYAENSACRSCEVASGNYDVRQTFSANGVYQIPFGKGHHFSSGGGKIAQSVLGGWELSGLGSMRSGNPVNVIVSRSAASLPDGLSLQDGKVFQRPDYVGGSVVPANQSITNWINKAAFATPANGTWGNAGRNLIRGPRFMQADIGLTKNLRVTERVVMAFRAEAFNVFNRAQFGDPVGNFSSPSFGQITTTVNNGSVTGSGTPREFQFALRMKF